MTWRERVRPDIRFTSPSGKEFTAEWTGNDRSKEKRLGIFSYPKVRGVIAQDLDRGGVPYPLNFWFSGDDNDLDAEQFFETWDELGVWQILHPTKGLKILQPVRIAERVRPVEGGNITEIVSEWLEAEPPSTVASLAELGASVLASSDDASNEALQQFEDGVVQDTVSDINSAVSAVEGGLSAYDEFMGDFNELSGEVNAQINSIRLGIQNSLSLSPLDLGVLGAQIQSIMRLPANIKADLARAQEPFKNFIASLSGSLSSDVTTGGKNKLLTSELFLAGAASGLSETSVNNPAVNRVQALESVALLGDSFEQMIDALDDAQDLFTGELLGDQYFSQSRSFQLSAQTVIGSSIFLLQSLFDLAAEKRFTLGQDRAPVEITIKEYGTMGEDDSNFDFFVVTNDLHGDDILLLPAGREVVVYVSP